MNRNQSLSVIIIVILLCLLGLCGCNESTNNSNGNINNNQVEVVSHRVFTWAMEERLGIGFIQSDEATRYVVVGVVKNNIEHAVNITVSGKFYDNDGNFIYETSDYVWMVGASFEEAFSLTVNKNETDFFENIVEVSFMTSYD